MSSSLGWLLCQACGARNPDDREHCVRCQQKLLVVSGGFATGELEGLEEGDPEDGFSFDEHLLERISLLEEAVRRTHESLDRLLSGVALQERAIQVNHAGWAALRDLLQEKGILGGGEWEDLWSAKLDFQLGVLEKRQRFAGLRDRALALYRGRRPERFQAALQEIEAALLAFDMDRALEGLESTLGLDPTNVAVALFLGETLFNEGESRRALEAFRRVLEVEPDHYEALVYAGVLHHEADRPEEALTLLRRASDFYPEAFLPSFSLGVVYADRGEPERAVPLLERAARIDPVPQALFLLGKSLFEAGALTRAIRTLEEVVRRDPSLDEAYLVLGLACLDRGWRRKALSAFREAHRLKPKSLRYHELVRYLSGAEASPLPPLAAGVAETLERAEELLRRDQPDRALACFRRVLAQERDHPTVLISFAVACLRLGRPREAEAAARRLLDLLPGEALQATAWATLMEALRSEGRLEEGNRMARGLLEESESPFTRTIAYYELACNLTEAGEDLDQALRYARASLDLAPEEIRAFPLAALGRVHHQRGEHREAVSYLTRSHAAGGSGDVLSQLGVALLAAGEEEEARRILAEARGSVPRGLSLEQRMMEFMRDSGRLLERVREQQRKKG